MQKFYKKKCTLSIIIALLLTSCTNKIEENINESESSKNVELIVESEDTKEVENKSSSNEDIRNLPALEEPISLSSTELLHTAVTITLYDKGDNELLMDCFDLINTYENLISSSDEKKETSEIYKLNNSGGNVVTLSDDVLQCLEYGIEYTKLSKGKFDVTIGNLSSLWGFSSNTTVRAKPKDDDILKSIESIDIDNIVIESNDVYLSDPTVKVDLGGIAKGYIADKVAEFLKSQGVETALIDLGGNILTVGSKPGNRPFKIGLREPAIESSNQIGIIDVVDKSLVSSGGYEKYFIDENDGEIYFHILDPTTGYPVVTDLAQATIISDTSVAGDGLSTAVFSLGSEEGLALVESLDNIETILVKKDGTIISSSGIGDEIKFVKK